MQVQSALFRCFERMSECNREQLDRFRLSPAMPRHFGSPCCSPDLFCRPRTEAIIHLFISSSLICIGGSGSAGQTLLFRASISLSSVINASAVVFGRCILATRLIQFIARPRRCSSTPRFRFVFHHFPHPDDAYVFLLVTTRKQAFTSHLRRAVEPIMGLHSSKSSHRIDGAFVLRFVHFS